MRGDRDGRLSLGTLALGKNKMTLAAKNQTIHDILDEKYLVFLEELTDCRFDAARLAFYDFRDALFLHMKTEESLVCSGFIEMGLEGGKRILEQVEGDHTILMRAIAKVERVLDANLESPGPEGSRGQSPMGPGETTHGLRRKMVLCLDICLRVRSVFEHHTLRETRDFYPHLDASAPVSLQKSIQDAFFADFPQID
jgi:hypothetical protein